MADTLQARLTEELAPELEVIRPIGKGSVAHVYLAREPGLKRLVAVKVLRRELASDALARKRFEREAQAAARIGHANVTRIHRIGHLADGVPFIVMEYIDGRTLADAVQAAGALPVDQVRQLLADVADALAAAHRHGIVHRDVKPSNIMRENGSERTVLMDFGIAGLLESGSETITRLTAQGVRLGDLRYMSPEQMRGDTVTAQADIYSLGVVGFELLAGQSPFGGTPGVQAMAAQLRGDRRRLAEVRPGLDAWLTSLIERCMAGNPAERPQAMEVAAVLTGRLGMGGGPDRPRSAMAAFFDELKRRRVYRVGVAYLTVLFGVIIQVADKIARYIPIISEDAIVITSAAGLPVALTLAWLFDIREGRISRTAALPEQGHAGSARRLRRLLPFIALGVFIVAALLLVWWRLSR